MKKPKIEYSPITKECGACNGIGKVNKIKCKNCKGTGKYIEPYWYVFYDGICFGMDTLK